MSINSISYPEKLGHNAELFMGSSPDDTRCSLGIFSHFPGGKASLYLERATHLKISASKVKTDLHDIKAFT